MWLPTWILTGLLGVGCGVLPEDEQQAAADTAGDECAVGSACDQADDDTDDQSADDITVDQNSGTQDDGGEPDTPTPVQLVANMTAAVVIGQASMTDNGSNRGVDLTADSLASPDGVGGDGTRIAIADRANNRILLYNTAPTTDGAAADLVLGASDFTTAGFAVCDKETFSGPRSVAFANGRLFIADGHHRAYVYNTLPTTNGQAADVYLGKSDCTAGTEPGELNSAWAHNIFAHGDDAFVSKWNDAHRLTQKFSGPTFTDGMTASAITDTEAIDVWTDGTIFCTADLWGNVVRIWDGIPTSPAAAPSVTLGGGGTDDSQFNQPHSCTYTGTHFVVADSSNHRLLVWNGVPTTDNQPADFVIGQEDFASKSANRGGAVAANTLNKPTMVRYLGGKLLVVDQQNHRVLIFQD